MDTSISKSNSLNKHSTSPYTKEPVYKNIQTCLKTVTLILLSFIIFYPPFLKGLFFEQQQLIAEIFIFSAFIIFSVLKIIKKEKLFLSSPLDYASLLIVLLYLISIVYAVSTRAAVSEFLKYVSAFAVFVMITEMAAIETIKKLFMWIMVLSSAGMCIIGIDGAAGGNLVSFLNKALSFMNWKEGVFFALVDGFGRINSAFQYSNTLAAYLMVVFFVNNVLFLTAKSRIQKIVTSSASFLMFVTFVLTQSRIAYVIFAMALLVYVVLIPRGLKIRSVLSYVIPVIPGLIVLLPVYHYIQTADASKERIWLFILGGLIVSAVLGISVKYAEIFLKKFSTKTYFYAGLIIVPLVIAAALLTFNWTTSLVLSHSASQADSDKTVLRYVSLTPGKTYTLKLGVEATAIQNKPYAYRIDIGSKSKKDILLSTTTSVNSVGGNATNGKEVREIDFKVPEESKIIGINFINTYSGTSVKFSEAKVVEKDTGKTVKNIKLKYRLLPEFFASRILEDTKASTSGLIRNVYAKDWSKTIGKHLILGAGGGAWAVIYREYQSFNYSGNYLHSYVMQVWLETGFIGLLALLLFIGAIVVYFIYNNYKNEARNITEKAIDTALFVSIMALLAHAAMDFDFGMMSIFLLLWTLAALLNSGHRTTKPDEEKSQSVSLPFKVYNYFSIKKISYKPVVTLLISAAVLFVPLLFTVAFNQATKGVEAYDSGNLDKALSYYSTAKTLDPIKPQYKIDYANLLTAKSTKTIDDIDEGDAIVKEAERWGSNEYQIVSGLGDYYLKRGDIVKGLRTIDKARKMMPLSPNAWEQELTAYYQVIRYYEGKGDNASTKVLAKEALKIKDDIENDNSNSIAPFDFNENTKKIIEEIMKYK